MLTKGQEYTDQGQDYYEERYRERVLRRGKGSEVWGWGTAYGPATRPGAQPPAQQKQPGRS